LDRGLWNALLLDFLAFLVKKSYSRHSRSCFRGVQLNVRPCMQVKSDLDGTTEPQDLHVSCSHCERSMHTHAHSFNTHTQ
jgi:hypothetical protein